MTLTLPTPAVRLGALALAACAVLSTGAARAAPIEYVYGRPDAPIASGAIVPAGSDIFFVSGIPGSAASGNTEAQTAEVLTKLGGVLKAHGYDYKDVVNMKVYLVGDPALGGKMDFMGMMTSYKKVFGTADEPNRPSRVTVQVAGLAAPGALVEIELTAAKAK
jgi:enamine deaminase RidA (YjgF/YER057c/UK114 family)